MAFNAATAVSQYLFAAATGNSMDQSSPQVRNLYTLRLEPEI